MPRQPRIDAPGALHHVIIRGIERTAIFKDDADRTELDERILGDSDFVMQVLESAQEQMEERYRLAAEGHTFDRMITQVSEHSGLSVEELPSPGKHPHRVKARSVAAYLAVRKFGIDGTAVGRLLGDRAIRSQSSRYTGRKSDGRIRNSVSLERIA